MKIPKEVSIKEVHDKLQDLLDKLDLSRKLKVDDIKNVIITSRKPRHLMAGMNA